MRYTIGWVVAILFTVANIGFAIYAAMLGEIPHTAAHAVAVLVGVFAVTWFGARRRRAATRVADQVAY